MTNTEAGEAPSGTGKVGEVKVLYFAAPGRADPLIQMFAYHGHPYHKEVASFDEWNERKARGDGGEFGGGLPQVFFRDEAGKEQRLSQTGAILRSFGIRFGYYDPGSV